MNRGPLSDEARDFLDRHRVAHLATCDARGAPHVIPLCFARLGEHLYFVADDKPKRHGPTALRRLANLDANPRVALVVDDYDDDWHQLAYLLLQLDAARVADDGEYTLGLQALRMRYEPYRTMPLARPTHPMIRLTLDAWHLWRAGAGG